MVPMRRFLWLVPVIVAPLVVLLVMQYQFLRKLEHATAAAERNTLRNSLEDVAREVEMSVSERVDRVLDVTSDVLAAPDALSAHVRAHGETPGVKTFFAARFNSCGPLLLDGHGGGKMVAADEAHAIDAALQTVTMLRKPVVRSHQPRTIDQRDPHNRIVVRPIADASGMVVGAAGVVFDEKLAQSVIEQMSQKILRKRLCDDYIVTRVRPEEYFSGSRADGGFLTRQLGVVFSDWRIGIRDNCATPEEMAASSFRINALWSGMVMLALAMAIGLAIHGAARQMRLSQMKSDFVSNVSHELRTPISSIRVFGEYMRLGRVKAPEKIREYGEYIETESRRLTQLINNILDFSRIESAEKKYRFADSDVTELVAETVSAFGVPLRERGFTITFEAPGTPLPPVSIDRDALGQAIVNLLDNAVKYSGERREIIVSVSSARDEVRIAIVDRGIGIAAREQKKIFDKFYRVASGLVHDVKGSGLGLAIVRHVVHAHRGHVEIRSEPGQGSTFTIVLPAPAAAGRSTELTKEFA
jgi:signal transduction histidine kinase